LFIRFAYLGESKDERFYDESKFWPSLAYQEIGITADQAEKLKANKKLMTERREELNRTLNDLEMLRDRAVRHVNSLNEAIDRMQSHLNPEQQAKFAVWVAKNRWCMEMMSALWGKQ